MMITYKPFDLSTSKNIDEISNLVQKDLSEPYSIFTFKV